MLEYDYRGRLVSKSPKTTSRVFLWKWLVSEDVIEMVAKRKFWKLSSLVVFSTVFVDGPTFLHTGAPMGTVAAKSELCMLTWLVLACYGDENIYTLQWRHNGRDGVSNHQPHGCLLNRLSTCRSKLRVTGLCAGNSPVTGEFPAEKASNAENVSIWWRNYEISALYIGQLCFAPGSHYFPCRK